MKRKHVSTGLALMLLATAACSDALGPGNASEADRDEILAVLNASGWFDETFGDDGATEDASLAVAGFDLGLQLSPAAPQDTVPLTQRWGRRFHAPTERSRSVEVRGDTAEVTWSIRFADGEFLLDRTRDAQVNPTSKPMDVTETRSATLVRRAEADSAGRRWRLVSLSPSRLVNTAVDARTVTVTRVSVSVNGTVVGDVTDVGRHRDAAGWVGLEVGDEVRVTAAVSNVTGHDNVPETFVFLHVFHARTDRRGWARLAMRDNGDGTWTRGFVVHHDGRQRLMIDAIDSQTFNTDDGDDYRAEVWGVPYRVGRLGG